MTINDKSDLFFHDYSFGPLFVQENYIHIVPYAANITCDKKGLNMDYLPYMRSSLTNPLIKNDADGVPDVIKLMDDYDIIKEDFDNIMEVSKWPNSKDQMSKLASKTKAAFTRIYNKEVHMTPYATGVVMKKKCGGAAATEDDMYGDEDRAPSSSDEEGEKIDLDTMIKNKKKENKEAAKNRTQAASSKTTNSKGKCRGKRKS